MFEESGSQPKRRCVGSDAEGRAATALHALEGQTPLGLPSGVTDVIGSFLDPRTLQRQVRVARQHGPSVGSCAESDCLDVDMRSQWTAATRFSPRSQCDLYCSGVNVGREIDRLDALRDSTTTPVRIDIDPYGGRYIQVLPPNHPGSQRRRTTRPIPRDDGVRWWDVVEQHAVTSADVRRAVFSALGRLPHSGLARVNVTDAVHRISYAYPPVCECVVRPPPDATAPWGWGREMSVRQEAGDPHPRCKMSCAAAVAWNRLLAPALEWWRTRSVPFGLEMANRPGEPVSGQASVAYIEADALVPFDPEEVSLPSRVTDLTAPSRTWDLTDLARQPDLRKDFLQAVSSMMRTSARVEVTLNLEATHGDLVVGRDLVDVHAKDWGIENAAVVLPTNQRIFMDTFIPEPSPDEDDDWVQLYTRSYLEW